jgi:hypothetical protein
MRELLARVAAHALRNAPKLVQRREVDHRTREIDGARVEAEAPQPERNRRVLHRPHGT